MTWKSKECGLVAIGGLTGVFIIRQLLSCRRKFHLKAAIAKREQERQAGFSQIRRLTAHIDKEKTEAILSLSLKELIEALQSEKYSPTEALEAYQFQAMVAQDKTNCACQFFLEATEIAKNLEKKYAGRSDKPAFYGVPFSVKENYNVKGYDCTAGFAQRLGKPCFQDNLVVETLRVMGGIPFVQTNFPQNLFTFASSNPIYGATTHPLDSRRTPGGSSSGEGSLVAMGGSPIGLGGDIAGSIRLPAHFCGISGLRPTFGRMSRHNTLPSSPGVVSIGTSNGLLTPTVSNLVTAMRELWTLEKNHMYLRDPYTIPMGFREELFASEKPLKIGYYDYDGFTEATPACRRAVMETKDLLERTGHTLVPWTPPNVAQGYRLLVGGCFVDGGTYISSLVDSDIAEPINEPFLAVLRYPVWLKRFLSVLLGHIRPRRSALLSAFPRTPMEIKDLYTEIGTYRRQFTESWLSANLDLVICPPNACPALPVTESMQVFEVYSYTLLYNVLDYPGGVVPVTKVTQKDEKQMEKYVITDPVSQRVKKACEEGTVGLPIGVQVIGLPFQEETCLRVMTLIEDTLKKK